MTTEPRTAGTLKARLDSVCQRIAAAAEASGRAPESVRLLPVTKNVPVETLRELYALGYPHMGENRVQELRKKAAEMDDLPVEWAMIGHLQTNKAGAVSRLVTEVQSVDSLRVAEALSRNLVTAGRSVKALMQVNTSGEEAKYGFTPAEAAETLSEIRTLPGLDLRGFMTMAPFTSDTDLVRNTFRRLRELRDDLAPELPELSMGMSGDFETAIEEGATVVRIGGAIFGPRG